MASTQYYRKVTSIRSGNNRNFRKIIGRFYIVSQINKAREISNFQEYQTKFWDVYLTKADPERFSFWVNYIYAKKQALFDICGLMQSQKSSYQSD